MRCRRARTGNGNMRQRCQVVEGESLAMQKLAEVTIANAGFDRHSLASTVKLDDSIEQFCRAMIAGAIGDAVERMSRAQRFDPVAARDELAHLLGRLRPMSGNCIVCIIASPIGLPGRHIRARQGYYVK